MRVPIGVSDSEQVAWATRATLAQPLTDEALRSTSGSSGPERLVAALCWRTTHRSPVFLDQRRAVSGEAAALAQAHHRPDRFVEAAVANAVDAWESGDPDTANESLGLARWYAMSSDNPRLRWYVRMTEADTSLVSHLVQPDQSPFLVHPLARAGQAVSLAGRGDVQRASQHFDRAISSIDDETSVLLVYHLLSNAAVAIGDPDRCVRLSATLEPWSSRVAVDAHGWWIAGPVAADLCALRHAAGEHSQAATWWQQAWRLATGLGDQRSLRRLETLRTELDRQAPDVMEALDLTVGVPNPLAVLDDRELDVLRLIAAGRTNREIGQELAFSTSTIRLVMMSIYRKLGVPGRSAAKAIAGTADFSRRR